MGLVTLEEPPSSTDFATPPAAAVPQALRGRTGQTVGTQRVEPAEPRSRRVARRRALHAYRRRADQRLPDRVDVRYFVAPTGRPVFFRPLADRFQHRKLLDGNSRHTDRLAVRAHGDRLARCLCRPTAPGLARCLRLCPVPLQGPEPIVPPVYFQLARTVPGDHAPELCPVVPPWVNKHIDRHYRPSAQPQLSRYCCSAST